MSEKKKGSVFNLFRKTPSTSTESVDNSKLSPGSSPSRRRHTTSTFDPNEFVELADAVVVGTPRISVIVEMLDTGVKKKMQLSDVQFERNALLEIFWERFELPRGTGLNMEYLDPATQEKFVLSTPPDFRDCLEEARSSEWSVIRLLVRKSGVVMSALPPPPSSPVVVVHNAAPSPKLTAQSSSSSSSPRMSPRPKKSSVEKDVDPVSATVLVKKKSSSRRKSSTSAVSSKLQMEVPQVATKSDGSPRIQVSGSQDDFAVVSTGSVALGTATRARSSTVDATLDPAASLDEISREQLLHALKTEREVPKSLIRSDEHKKDKTKKKKKLTTTIRRPKDGPVTKGVHRSLEDIAKILSADTTFYDDQPNPRLSKSGTSKAQRFLNEQKQHPKLLRHGSVAHLSSIPTSGTRPRSNSRVLNHQLSLQDLFIEGNSARRSVSVLVTPTSSPPRSDAPLSRQAAMDQLNNWADSLRKSYPKEDLKVFFERKRKRHHLKLLRVTAAKYAMVMPVALTLSKSSDDSDNSSTQDPSPKGVQPGDRSSVGHKDVMSKADLRAVLDEICRLLGSENDEQAVSLGSEQARALCFMSPFLAGGSAALAKEIRPRKPPRPGALQLITILKQVSARFSKAEMHACDEAIVEVSKDLSMQQKQTALLSPATLSARRSTPKPSRKWSGLEIRTRSSSHATGKSLDFLEVDIKALADALVVIDFENLSRIPVEDFIFKRWESPHSEEQPGKLSRMFTCVKRWVHLGDWVASEIVCTPKLRHRTNVMRRFIDLASELWMRGNFQSATAVVSALHSGPIARLRDTWKGLSNAAHKKFEALSQLCGPQRHFHLVREEMIKRMHTRKEDQQMVVIPFLGIVTKELTALMETSELFVEGRKLDFETVLIWYKVVGKFYEALDAETELPAPDPDTLSYAAKLSTTLSEAEMYEHSERLESPLQRHDVYLVDL